MSYWIQAKGFDNYEVSNDGFVRNKKTGKILKPYLNRKNGYERVWLNGKNVYVHILMVNSFFSSYTNNYKIVYIDKNKAHNDIKNFDFIPKKCKSVEGK